MGNRAKVLIVDDDESIRTQMKWAFGSDYEVFLAEDRPTALEIVRSEHPAVVTLDLGLPPHPHESTEGLRAMSEICEVEPNCKVIVISGQDERENALTAIAQGAADFFFKPIRVDALRIVVDRALRVRDLEVENQARRRQAQSEPLEAMIGSSPTMQRVFATIRKVAATESPVLILGETGTGKELAARAVHRLSRRAGGPLAAINCGAIPATLLEAELFGHEKGAFTDAHSRRRGRLEMAQNGTIFLDEIGELSTPLQVALLRFLQEGVFQRVGGREDLTVDARLIAATNADLQREIRDGSFREDLYFRLSVVEIRLPPLRERGEDVMMLADAFLARFGELDGKSPPVLSRSARSAIQSYAWPGNVRELENRVKRAIVMAEGRNLTAENLGFDSKMLTSGRVRLKEARSNLEREMVRAALARHGGNLSRVAAELGISRPTLYEMMDRLEIKRPGSG